MGDVEVIAVVAVLADQLVVRLDFVLVAAAYDFHPDARLIRDGIEHRTGVLQIVIERNRIGVEIDEIETCAFVDARDAHQIVETAFVEPLSVAEARMLVKKLAGALVGPAVIGADEACAIAARFAAYRRSAVPARIEERVDPAVDVAIENELPVHDLADDEVALVWNLGLMPKDDPRAMQDAAPLFLEDLRARISGTVYEKSAAFPVKPEVAGPIRKRGLDDCGHGALRRIEPIRVVR